MNKTKPLLSRNLPYCRKDKMYQCDMCIYNRNTYRVARKYDYHWERDVWVKIQFLASTICQILGMGIERKDCFFSGLTQLELECTKLVAIKKKILWACFHICFKNLFIYLVEPVQSKYIIITFHPLIPQHAFQKTKLNQKKKRKKIQTQGILIYNPSIIII